MSCPLNKRLSDAEPSVRAAAVATMRVFTPEELVAYAAALGVEARPMPVDRDRIAQRSNRGVYRSRNKP